MIEKVTEVLQSCMKLMVIFTLIIFPTISMTVNGENVVIDRSEFDKTIYTYTLSLPVPESNKEVRNTYDRTVVESFLCSQVDNFIRSEELLSLPATESTPTQYFTRRKINAGNQIKQAYDAVIHKWFEDKVTVTCRGNLTILDINVIRNFYKKVNQLIGNEKFEFKPNRETANIIIEIAPPDNSDMIHKYLGETTILNDNLRTRIGIKDTNIEIDQYKSGIGEFINYARSITFTPAEKKFRKENRLVKSRIMNVLDPQIRHFTLVHELFHTLGFSGHSPYPESYLFPVPAKSYKDSFRGLLLGSKLMTPMAEQMTKILYRPEVLPGMSVKEAAVLLTKLNQDDGKEAALCYFKSIQPQLLERKQHILQQAKENYDRRMAIYIEIAKLERKELDLLAELEEIRTYKKDSLDIIAEIKTTKSLVGRLGRIRREVILIQNNKKKFQAQLKDRTKSKSEHYRLRKKIKLCDEELVVLNDILNTQEASAAEERKITQVRSGDNRSVLEKKLQHVVRQLSIVNKQLNKT